MDRHQDDRLTQALVALSGVLFTQQTLHEDLERLVRIAAHVIERTSGVSVSMLIDGGASTVATTDQVTLELDLVQYEAGDGPCLAALGGPTIRIGYIPADEQFPHFAIGAADRRVLSSLSIPVTHEQKLVGSLNLYSRARDAFDAAAEQTAMVFAAEAGLAIAKSVVFEKAHAIRRTLQEAHDQAAQMSRAQGVLMGIHNVSAEQAMRLIESAAGANEEPLAAAARRILDATAEYDEARPGDE
jgi:GAF domain-containing protein